MNIIKFIYSKELGTISQKNILDNKNLDVLAYFLREGRYMLNCAKKAIKNKNTGILNFDMMGLEFYNEQVKIFDQFTDEDEYPDYSFTLSKQDLAQIIDQYLEIIKDPPDEFYLKQYDDGRITIELEP